jgi:hypothetical protein
LFSPRRARAQRFIESHRTISHSIVKQQVSSRVSPGDPDYSRARRRVQGFTERKTSDVRIQN